MFCFNKPFEVGILVSDDEDEKQKDKELRLRGRAALLDDSATSASALRI